MLHRTVVYGSDELLADLATRAPALRIMPEARSAAVLRRWLATHHPRVIAFDHRDFTDDLIAIARQAQGRYLRRPARTRRHCGPLAGCDSPRCHWHPN